MTVEHEPEGDQPATTHEAMLVLALRALGERADYVHTGGGCMAAQIERGGTLILGGRPDGGDWMADLHGLDGAFLSSVRLAPADADAETAARAMAGLTVKAD